MFRILFVNFIAAFSFSSRLRRSERICLRYFQKSMDMNICYWKIYVFSITNRETSDTTAAPQIRNNTNSPNILAPKSMAAASDNGLIFVGLPIFIVHILVRVSILLYPLMLCNILLTVH
ncbi:unnamed protein product [Ceratitis capitata]|uniref:(Mediterranean fruit fly) hypothetical protein n=1 Tax=Ceratitis capitata TaxID=7213 RepID=A0A811U7B5_CERCA|nr:unnamed protein product [Ceratitis capitata]